MESGAGEHVPPLHFRSYSENKLSLSLGDVLSLTSTGNVKKHRRYFSNLFLSSSLFFLDIVRVVFSSHEMLSNDNY